MTQIGCFVPAEKALVGLVDRIFTRIASLESASVAHASSFTIDLNQVGLMLRHATPRSLLLLDEFGKGTSSVGESLAARLRMHAPPQAGTPLARTVARTRTRCARGRTAAAERLRA